MDTPDSLRAEIDKGIQSNRNFVDEDYQFMRERLWCVVFETTQAMRRSSAALEQSLPEKDHAALLILTNCVSDLHASYQSMRSGFQRASAMASRGLLENMALVVAMKADETDQVFEQYKAGKYNIPKAVGLAKLQFPAIGAVYGVLSERYVHEPYEALGRAFIQQGSITRLLLVPPVGQNNFLGQFVLIANLGVLAGILGMAIEWVFAQWITPTMFYSISEDNHLVLKSSQSAKANLEIADKLEALIHSLNQRPKI